MKQYRIMRCRELLRQHVAQAGLALPVYYLLAPYRMPKKDFFREGYGHLAWAQRRHRLDFGTSTRGDSRRGSSSCGSQGQASACT
jgi:hypothetical protein